MGTVQNPTTVRQPRWRIREQVCGVTVHTWTITGTRDEAWAEFVGELRLSGRHRYTPHGTSRLVLTEDGAR